MKLMIPFFVFAVAACALGQDVEIESGGAVPAIVQRDVRVHASPAGRLLGALRAGTSLDVIGISPNGWVRVRASAGKGWVDRRYLRPATAAAMPLRSFALNARHGAEACAPDLASCTVSGCADPPSPHGLLNKAKRRAPAGNSQRLALADFSALQLAADNLVGQAAELDASDRQSIRSIQIGTRTTGEGQMVAVTGFLVGKPHPNTGESVNCNLTDAASNDFHIPLAQRSTDSSFAGIVVEMIPQSRNAAWTIDALKQVEAASRRVIVVGQLFYDNVHRVNKDATHPLPGQPARFSLWEVHPIVDFFVCISAPCDVNDPTLWTKLENITLPLQ